MEAQVCEEIPIYEKVLLTVDEATEYSNIGRDKIYELLKDKNCDFVLKNGRKLLVKRKKFEKYLENVIFL